MGVDDPAIDMQYKAVARSPAHIVQARGRRPAIGLINTIHY